MNKNIEILFSRRSIRKYKDKPVEDEKIDMILKAGMAAPSAGNQQPWHFIVIKDRALLDKIPEVHPYSKMLKESPVAIVVIGEPALEKHKDFWIQDCSAATQNILLCAKGLGLGTVWLGVYPDKSRTEGVSKILGLPKGVIPLSIIPIGYPDEEKGEHTWYKEERVRYDKW